MVVPAGLWTQSLRNQEAPAGFDTNTNGFSDQTTMDMARDAFEERETQADGLGPVYNAQSCAECHQTPVTGAGSQVTELRVAPFPGRIFPFGSLINDRATDATIQEQVPRGAGVTSLRSSLSIMGDGYVEVVPDETLQALANASGGETVQVALLEKPGVTRLGRFGWKNQHASLESFAGDAYLNEMGVTSPMFPTENTSNGHSVADYDFMKDPENEGEDVELFASYMRSLKTPPRGAVTGNVISGERVFRQVGCASCHTPRIVTAPANSNLPGYGTVPESLGGKVIHPFSDYALHNIGTGDGISQPPAPANKMRTAPLWGLRARNRFMHDNESLTFGDAIRRHGNEASESRGRFAQLPQRDRENLLEFLRSL